MAQGVDGVTLEAGANVGVNGGGDADFGLAEQLLDDDETIAARSATRASRRRTSRHCSGLPPGGVAEFEVAEACEALHLVYERAGEQAPGRGPAVAVDVVEHDLVVVGASGTPVDDLLAGQVIEGELMLLVDAIDCRAGSTVRRL
jgi:hypothetical protein